ncbi:MAG: hypothetical protein GXX79_10240 [Actinomycetales bacterium]|nr:hypothetical protein [Actinomycetales bacterium]
MSHDLARSPAGEFLTPPRYRRLIVTAALVVVGAVVLVLVVWAPWNTSPTARTTPSPSTMSTSTPTSTATMPTPSGRHALVRDDVPTGAGPVALPRGRSRVGAIRTGYPRTTRGAVAAAIEYAGHTGCLDASCVNALVHAAVDPDWPQARQEYLAGMRHSRSQLGIPSTSRVPAGATLAASPMAFQIVSVPSATSQTADPAPQVRVVLLSYLAMAGPSISPTNALIVVPVTLRWSRGDWKITDSDDTSYAHLKAVPGTAQAVAAGWREFLA